MTPTLLFGWIPYTGILDLLYDLYLFVRGISVSHKLTIGKAFLALLIPVLILMM